MPNTGLRGSSWYRDQAARGTSERAGSWAAPPLAPRVGVERNPTAREVKGAGRETDADIFYEARERFRQVNDWEAGFRSSFLDDVKFCNGDSDNQWQWPDSMLSERGDKPSLTINKTRQHCLQIQNDGKQNKPMVRVSPTGSEATKASADVFQGVIRHIEYESNASVAYDTASEFQIQGGIGWWRVTRDWEHGRSMDQVLRIQRIRDALSVYMDPDIRELDGSDANWAFVVDDVPRGEFETKYPEYADRIPQGATPGPTIAGGWLDHDHVRVAEYFRKVSTDDTMHLLPDGSTIRESELGLASSLNNVRVLSRKSRRVMDQRIEWFKIVGGEIVDEAIEPGKYIPLVRLIGEETIIEGKLVRKGHVRALKDPQRIYNYWASSAVEQVALQSKSPYTAAAESIEGFQAYWDTANTENHSVLPWNARDDAGNQLPEPRRQEPPQMADAYVKGLQISQMDLQYTSGQYQATMGQSPPNTEISGKAIALRQRQGDNATYHFIDHLAIAIRFTGKILLDLIPIIYDTPRIMRILQPDGTVGQVRLDPNAPQALTQLPNPTPQNAGGLTPPTPQQALQASVVRIFNPTVGEYEVEAEVGPNYATKRQQAFDAFTQIISTAPSVMSVAGDLLMKAADFPMAEELADRLQRLVPPQALGQGPTPQEQALTQQLQGSQAHVALLSEKLAVAEMKLKARDERTDIDAYEAVTKRMGQLLSMRGTDGPYNEGMEVRALIQNMVNDALKQVGMGAVSAAAAQDLTQQGAVLSGLAGQGPPGAPSAPPGGLPGMASGQAAALSPVRPPMRPGA